MLTSYISKLTNYKQQPLICLNSSNNFLMCVSSDVFDDPGKQSLEGFTTFRRWVEVGIWLEGYSRDFVSWRYPSYIKWKMQVAEGKEKNSKERTRRWNAVSRWIGFSAVKERKVEHFGSKLFRSRSANGIKLGQDQRMESKMEAQKRIL